MRVVISNRQKSGEITYENPFTKQKEMTNVFYTLPLHLKLTMLKDVCNWCLETESFKLYIDEAVEPESVVLE